MKFVTAAEAAKLIKDDVTVGVGGMGLAGWPEEVGQAIAANYKETGHPKGLSLKQGCAMGDWKIRGTTVLGIEGLVTKWCGAHIGSSFALNELVLANKIECHCLPQGVIVNLWREIAAGRPGILSKVGLGTFIDPRIQGGKMNEVTKTDLVELIDFQGDEYLFYKSFPVDVALLRGTIADEKGNISFENEGIINEGLAIAQATKNSGGIVIVQVEYVTKAGTLKPKDVRIPGILVDYVVQATFEEASWQTEGTYFNPAFSGQIKQPIGAIEPMPFDIKKIIARRCTMEFKRGGIINLGVGIPASTAKVAAEEGLADYLTFATESGIIGGVPAPLPDFGSSFNPEATITHGEMFDLINGGGLDLTCLGMSESDSHGNVNVSKFNNRLIGPGGFIDITQSTPKIVFCGTFMAKAKIEIKDKKLNIIEEGKINKFVNDVEQITFAGGQALDNQIILYITERCVFQLIKGEMTIIEIAPGIDLQKDILDLMNFSPVVPEGEIKLMDPDIFDEKWGKLSELI
jgi:propionate CoA-transferase